MAHAYNCVKRIDVRHCVIKSIKKLRKYFKMYKKNGSKFMLVIGF